LPKLFDFKDEKEAKMI